MNIASCTNRTALLLLLLGALASSCAHRQKGVQQQAGDRDKVTAEDIDRTPGESIEKYLMGRFPGVWVSTAADGSIAVRIRGANTVHGSTEPLYIVDGIALQPGPGGTLSGIKPQDIASIQVLKDVASTAAYGMRGANGVIVIKMKQAGQ